MHQWSGLPSISQPSSTTPADHLAPKTLSSRYAGMCTVDVWGRRPLLMWGAVGCAASMACATAAYQAGSALGLLGCMCTFVLAFSMSWAGVYWVVVSECFSMGAKSPATSAATALLFLTGRETERGGVACAHRPIQLKSQSDWTGACTYVLAMQLS